MAAYLLQCEGIPVYHATWQSSPTVVDVKGIKQRLYRLQCQFGILNGRISESSLETYYGKLDVSTTDWKKEPQLSLHEATIKYNPDNAFYGNSCNCKTGCKSKRCSCKLACRICTKRCHNSQPCSNGYAEKEKVIVKSSVGQQQHAKKKMMAHENVKEGIIDLDKYPVLP